MSGRGSLGLLTCVLLLASATLPSTGMDDPQRGAPLYLRYCAVCHGAGGRGDGPNAPFIGEDRPRDLTDARYMGSRSDERLARVIAEGGEAIQGSRFMPPWGRTLSSLQIRDLVAYVRTLATAAPGGAGPLTAEPPGAALARELGCPLCHRIGRLASPSGIAPGLDGEGSRAQRAWLERFLRAPHAIRPVGYQPLSGSQMPDFRLSEEEVGALTGYLLTRRQPRLERWPDATPSANLVRRGLELFRRHACRACHVYDGDGGRAGPDLSLVAGRLRPGWTRRFIQDPQATDPLSAMPRLGLDADDALAVTHFLFAKGIPVPDLAPKGQAVAQGRRLFETLGCERCHADRPSVSNPLGPDLTTAGDKLRPEWLRTFLARPSTIRPWLPARMPSFRLAADQTAALVELLTGSRDPAAPALPERLRFAGSLSEDSVRVGRRLASRAFLSCASCHVGEERPEGPREEWAPDFRLSARRLHPDWIVRWLLDPQRLAPGTRMPAYFSDAASGPEEILDGDEERQILALRDYILSLAASGSPEGSAADPAARD